MPRRPSGGAAGEALLDERAERVDVAAADLLGALEREAAAEDGEPREEPLLCGPRAGRSSRRSSLRGVRWRSGASRRPDVRSGRRCVEPLEQLDGRQDPGACSGQLDRERQVVEAAADGGHGLDRLATGSRARERASTASGLEQRLDRVLALSCDPKRGSARHEQVEIGARRNQLGEGRRARRGAARSCRAGAASASRRHARRESRGRRSPGAIAVSRRSGSVTGASDTQKTPSGKSPTSVCRDLQRESRLAAAARRRSSVTTRCPRASANELGDLAHRARSIGLVWLGRFVAFSERSGGKASLPSWYRRSGSGMILEPVKAEVGELDGRLEQPPGAVGKDDLAAVGGGADARGPVDVEADVALVRSSSARRCARRCAPEAARRRARVGRPRPPRPRPLHLRRRRRTRRPACRPRRRRGARTRPEQHDGARRAASA